MNKIILSLVLLFTCASLMAEQKYAIVTTMLENDRCIVFSWLPKDGKRTKVEYEAKATKSHGIYNCEVKIPISDFEQLFEVCFLTGLSNTREGIGFRKPFGAGFYGGAEDGRNDIYWSEWSDAEHTHADYRCELKAHNKRMKRTIF